MGPPPGNGKAKPHQTKPHQKRAGGGGGRAQAEVAEIKRLDAIIDEGAPARGSTSATEGYAAARKFDELPLSVHTQRGLAACKYETLTTIQRAALPHALAGRDILGAAKTGSGKTLCFIIPVMEKLYRAHWTRLDGLGGLIMTPVRELALQIFQELRKVGANHELSAGLLIGGKNVGEERLAISRMNILVATPGRLLQHMDETPGFDTTSLQILVLDEADRLLDMGFAATLDAILGALPVGRQTLLFSATQTKSVKDLARLSLQDPEYLAVHEAADSATPLKLEQAVAVIAPEQKMDVLWSFVKSHLATKTMVFLSTCKQVRFFHEVFRRLRPGVPLRALHGGMKQMKRMGVFAEFCQAEHMVLFATDVAGRGLDFPSVDWVVQVDCPEDTAAYIHRVGRTARYLAAGRALLLLTTREAPGMRAQLEAARIPVKLIKINPAKQHNIGPALQALLSKSTQLKEWGQRALVAYTRSLVLAPNKAVFSLAGAPPDLEALANSWGLAAAPRVRFLKRVGGQKQVVASMGLQDPQEGDAGATDQQAEGIAGDSEEESGDEDEAGQATGVKSTLSKAAAASQKVKASSGSKAAQLVGGGGPGGGGSSSDSGDDDDLMVVKRRDIFELVPGEEQETEGPVTGGAAAAGVKKKKKLRIKLTQANGQRVVFGEDGQALHPLEALAADKGQSEGGVQGEPTGDEDGLFVMAEGAEERFATAATMMKQRDKVDKARLKQLRAEVKARLKARRRAADAAEREEGAGPTVQLGSSRSHGSDEEESGSDTAGSSGDSGSEEEGTGWQQRPRSQQTPHDSSGDGSDSDGGGSDMADILDSSDEEQGAGTASDAGRSKARQQKVGTDTAQMSAQHKRQSVAGPLQQLQEAPSRKKARHTGVAELSLAEQEALVLERIASGRRNYASV